MALRKSGWKDSQIAEEMGIEPKSVTNAIYRYRKAQKAGQEPQESVITGKPVKEFKEVDPLAASQAPEDKAEKIKQIDMGKVNALRDARWSIGRIAEEMHIPPEEIAEKIFDHKIKEQKTAKA